MGGGVLLKAVGFCLTPLCYVKGWRTAKLGTVLVGTWKNSLHQGAKSPKCGSDRVMRDKLLWIICDNRKRPVGSVHWVKSNCVRNPESVSSMSRQRFWSGWGSHPCFSSSLRCNH